VGQEGHFLTASHVLRAAFVNCGSSIVGLVVKDPDGNGDNLFRPILRWNEAQSPYDIAAGRIGYASHSWFSAPTPFGAHWLDVATYGYPETALNVGPAAFNIHLRTMKGHVQRPVPAGELPTIGRHPDCLELNFQIPAGMSGAPLFRAVGADRQELLGVCVGSYSAELTLYSHIEIDNAGEKYKERQIKTEQYGLAQLIEPLLDWAPDAFGGRTLRGMLSRSD
jgi:hypothetical protein